MNDQLDRVISPKCVLTYNNVVDLQSSLLLSAVPHACFTEGSILAELEMVMDLSND